MAKTCANCGKKIGFTDSCLKLKDKNILGEECYSQALKGNTFQLTSWALENTFQDFKNLMSSDTKLDFKEIHAKEKDNKKAAKKAEHEKRFKLEVLNQERIKNHNVTKYGNLYFDNVDKVILEKKDSWTPYITYSYNDVLKYTPVDQGHSEKKRHGITRAITGDIIAGGAGAIVGAVTGGKNYGYVDELGVNISLKDGKLLTVRFINESTKRGKITEKAYQDCNYLCALLDSITEENASEKIQKVETVNSSETDITEQLKKLKSLVDDGILTQEEFEAKKKQMLGI